VIGSVAMLPACKDSASPAAAVSAPPAAPARPAEDPAAAAAVAAVIEAYGASETVEVVTSRTLIRGDDTIDRVDTVRFGPEDAFSWVGPGFVMATRGDRVLASVDMVPDRVVDVERGQDLLATVESILADTTAAPAPLLARGGAGAENWVGVVTGGLLRNPVATGTSIDPEGRQVIHLMDTNASASLIVDPATGMLASVEATDGASRGYRAVVTTRTDGSWPQPVVQAAGRTVVPDVEALQTRTRAEAVVIGGGDMAPDFTLPTTTGEVVHLADLRESCVVLDFWATWCGPCRAALPEIERLYQETGRNEGRVLVYGVNVMDGRMDLQRKLKRIAAFWAKEPVTFPTLVTDTDDVVNAWGINGIPVTVVIAPGGRVAARINGYTPGEWKHLLEVVNEALDQPPSH
jgi:thiol-disulfide isomerase/thioredoxin